MLYLGRDEIFESVEVEELIDVIESSIELYESGNYKMPTRLHMDYSENTLLLMPSSAERSVGTKLVNLTPKNQEKEIPVIQGCYILNDTDSGKILSIMEGSSLTALRTGAVGSVAIKHMTPKSIDSLGVIGAGVQGFHQALFVLKIRDLTEVWVYDLDDTQMKEFRERLLKEKEDIDVYMADSSKELVKESEVVITTTTSSEPVIPDESDIIEGKHFIGIGSYKPNMREFSKAIFKEVQNVFIDTEDAIEETGDLVTPLEEGWINEEQIYTIGKLLNQEVGVNPNSTTFFKSVGMALFDLVTANLIYKKAKELEKGKEIVF
uniref:Ornithine cyclodeaminase/mu-crystallin n=1 Tax=uncultured organism TaxID=155900 RepID=M1PV86_9ZZZZ|nr:ornithine cyclodeaminase/mu-crystallin [uncultured organism]